jgi:hypothetical protein
MPVCKVLVVPGKNLAHRQLINIAETGKTGMFSPSKRAFILFANAFGKTYLFSGHYNRKKKEERISFDAIPFRCAR